VVRSVVFDIIPLWLGLLVVGLPVTLASAFLVQQRLQGFAMYDPALGGDPLAYQSSLVHAGTGLLFCAAQAGSLFARKRSLGQSAASGSRGAFVRALVGLAVLCAAVFFLRFTTPFFVLALVAVAWTLCVSALVSRFTKRAD
jgi:hypothetical protein